MPTRLSPSWTLLRLRPPGTSSGVEMPLVTGRAVDAVGATTTSRLLQCILCPGLHSSSVSGGKSSSASCGNCERNSSDAPREAMTKSMSGSDVMEHQTQAEGTGAHDAFERASSHEQEKAMRCRAAAQWPRKCKLSSFWQPSPQPCSLLCSARPGFSLSRTRTHRPRYCSRA